MIRYGKFIVWMKYEDFSRIFFVFDIISYDEVELNFNEWIFLFKNV